MILICCCNCSYYYATTESGFCTIDNEIISIENNRNHKCNAYKEWFGSVE